MIKPDGYGYGYGYGYGDGYGYGVGNGNGYGYGNGYGNGYGYGYGNGYGRRENSRITPTILAASDDPMTLVCQMHTMRFSTAHDGQTKE